MNITRKFLILVVPFFFLIGASHASAGISPAIPPTEECLLLMDEALVEFKTAEGDDEERAVWQVLVNAGCLTKNPFDAKYNENKDSEQCVAAKAAYSEYLVPINSAMAPVAKRLDRVDRSYQKRVDTLYRKIVRAEKKGNEKLVRKLNRKSKAASKQYLRTLKKIARQNRTKVNIYDAPVWLAYADLIGRECYQGGSWFRKNRNALSVISLWLYLNY